jgi:hypothetical protein
MRAVVLAPERRWECPNCTATDVRRRQNTERVDQLEGEVAAIEDKLTGWKDALTAKKAELKEARSAKKGDE